MVTTSRSRQTDEEIQEQLEYERKYPKWTSSQDTLGTCFNQNRIEPHKNGEIERVHYKTDRYAELFGRGKDCSYFPGYGKIFNRKFKIWYQEFHSDEVRGTVDYYDIGNDKM